ncbi:MAG: response regulator [Burkholderiales bacterium]
MADTIPAGLEFDPQAGQDDFSEFGPSQFGDSSVAPLAGGMTGPSALSRAAQDDRMGRRINPQPGTRVLIIDESFALISGLRRLMRQNKLEPIEAVGGERGLELAFSMAPQLIFLAVAMPGMSGFNTLRALRRDPRTQDVPVIMMSSNVQATETSYLRRMGADDFMVKPFTRADVFKRIENLLDQDCIPRRPIVAESQPPSDP